MNVIKCSNGHFFDADTYTQCPHCGAAPVGAAPKGGKEKNEHRGFSLFGSKHSSKAQSPAPAPKPATPPAPVQPQPEIKAEEYLGPTGGSYTPPVHKEVYAVQPSVITPELPKKDVTVDIWQVTPSQPPVTTPTDMPKTDLSGDSWKPVPLQNPVMQEEPRKDVTMDFWQKSITRTSEEPKIPTVQDSVPLSVQTAVSQEPEHFEEIPKDVSAIPPSLIPPVSPAVPSTDDLREAVRAASASSEGKTMSYFSSMATSVAPPAADPIGVTVSAIAPASAASFTAPAAPSYTAPAAAAPVRQGISDPVVGWLVCIQGPCLGWSFHIGAGNNTIGRKEENRIVVPGDMKISGIRHAAIAYEPKRRNFYLHPGESSGLTYLNDEYITAPQKLSPRDIIELGDTKLLFVPLCGEDFSWETYLH